MRRKGKRYKKESQQARSEPVGLGEAVEKVKSFNSVKFDQTVECVLHLGIDPKQADQIVRGSMSLPHGIGKQKKVIAFCEGGDIEAAFNACGTSAYAIIGSSIYKAEDPKKAAEEFCKVALSFS